MFDTKKWRFFDTKRASAAWNMSLDEALMRNFSDNDFPIFRLYSWEKSLSLGRFSKIKQNIDLDQLKRKKFPYVRRISGGGILTHDNEISYALILPRRFIRERGVKESYRFLCLFLLRFYQKLGLKARFASECTIRMKHSGICLAGLETYDLVINGKKIGGNAQRYAKEALLQHGTVPISFDKVLFNSFFLDKNALESTVTLQELGVETDYEVLSKILRDTFSETFGIEIVADTFSVFEKQSADKLFKNKYTQSKWNSNGSDIYS